MTNNSPSRDGARARRLLIVEDDDLMHTFYKALFRRHKDEFACIFEKNAADALTHLRQGNIEAVVLDWDLPEINGIDLLRAMRSHPATKGVRVMIVSGRTRKEDQVRALASGADDYITKPFEIDIFLARLRGLLRR